MDLFSPRHLIVILVIVLLVFGTKKLKTIGADLGGAVRGFKKAMKGGEEEQQAAESAEAASAAAPMPQLKGTAETDAEFSADNNSSATRSPTRNPKA